MTSRRLMPAFPVTVTVTVILLLAVAWSLVVLALTRLEDPGDAQAALRAQGRPDGQVVTFTSGRVDPGQADVRPDEAAYIGSVSKTFTAAVTLRLADRGVLRVDDPVVTHLPAFRVRGPRAETEAITGRMLLEQTSGIPTSAGGADLGERDHVAVSARERVARLAEVPLVSAPGTQFHYSNSNYAVLGQVLESATGSPYPTLLREEVIEPLGLTRTNAGGEGYGRRVGCGRVAFFGAGLPRCLPHDPHGVAEGYLVSSPTDLAAFAEALRTGPFLSPGSRALMLEPADGREYGAGLFREGDVVHHPGDVTIAHADVGVDVVSAQGTVVLVNQAGQLYDSTAPFRVSQFGEPVGDGGYRTAALMMVTLATVVAVLIAADLLIRRRRTWWSAAVRVLVAVTLPLGLFYAAGRGLGLDGLLPWPLAVAAGPDLLVILAVTSLYLVGSAVAVGVSARRAA